MFSTAVIHGAMQRLLQEDALAQHWVVNFTTRSKTTHGDNIINPETGMVQADAQAVWNERWLDAVQRDNALRHEHQLSLNGGNEKTKYMFSLGYLNEDGILEATAFQRYSARANISSTVTEWFTANLNTSLAHSLQNFSDYDGTSTSNVWYSAQFVSPLVPDVCQRHQR